MCFFFDNHDEERRAERNVFPPWRPASETCTSIKIEAMTGTLSTILTCEETHILSHTQFTSAKLKSTHVTLGHRLARRRS